MARKKTKTEFGRIQLPKGKTANDRAKEGAQFPALQKFLVVSYDSDEQQWFYDIVFAVSEDAAAERIVKLRPYVIDVDTTDVGQMERMKREFDTITRDQSEAWLASVERGSGGAE